MVSTENPLSQWRSHLTALSDDALVAIANKGLLRRAQKDLQTDSTPEILESVEALRLRITEFTVTLPPSGPTQAACSCPSTETCRHILMACLWLRNQLTVDDAAPPPNAAPPPPVGKGDSSGANAVQPPAGLLHHTLEQLTQWAGKATLRKALDRLHHSTPAIQEGDPVIIQFRDRTITCRYFLSTGLEGMICSCKARQVCEHRVAAVLAYQQAHGVTDALEAAQPSSEKAALSESVGAPRSRQAVIAAAQQLLVETVNIGLLHISEACHQRFTTLSVSALGVDLPRLSLALRRIGDEIALSLKRNAGADESRLFLAIARTYALCEALARMAGPGRVDLIGQHRSRYDDVGMLDLVGMGAYHWQSQSGYAGLTVLFWQPALQQWCSWSEARPRFQTTSFDPVLRYRQPGPWEGVESPAQASQSCLRLMSARRNDQQRLSASTQSKALVVGPTRVDALQLGDRHFQNWQSLRTYGAATLTTGLTEFDALQSIVVVRPTAWGERGFDTVQQTLTWFLIDDQDDLLPLQVRFRPVDTHRLQVLEQLEPLQAKVWGIVGQLVSRDMGWTLYPISLLCDTASQQSAVMNLSFSETAVTAAAPSPPSDLGFEEEAAAIAGEAPSESASSPLELQIEQVMHSIQSLAEQGAHRLTETLRHDLRVEAQHLDAVGLTTLASALEKLAKAGQDAGSCLLQVRYLGQLCQEAALKARLG